MNKWTSRKFVITIIVLILATSIQMFTEGSDAYFKLLGIALGTFNIANAATKFGNNRMKGD